MKRTYWVCGLTIATLLASIAADAAQPGAVDPSFDVGRGPLRIGPGTADSVLVQPDQKVLVSGSFDGLDFGDVPPILRFNSDGSLDASFQSSVSLSTIGGATVYPNLLALQANGQVLVAIGADVGSTVDVIRLNSDGSIDPAFHARLESKYSVRIGSAALLSDGRLLIAGSFDTVNGADRPSLARLNSDGSLDRSFNPQIVSQSFGVQSTGKLIVPSNGQFYCLNSDGSIDPTFTSQVEEPASGYELGAPRIQPDDKIIFTAFLGGIDDRRISRLNSDGSADSTFEPYEGYLVGDIFLQADGKLIVGGGASGMPNRLNPDGTSDDSFHPDVLGVLAQQADGRLLAVGQICAQPYGIHRMFLDGTRDDSFAIGAGLMAIGATGIDRFRLLSNGEILINGSFNYIDRIARTSLARLQRDGSLDESFDATDTGVPHSLPNTVFEAQPDGKSLIGDYDTLLRRNSDGSIDSTFQYQSIQNAIIDAAKLQPSGKIVVQRHNQLNGGPSELIRLNSDGSIDPTFQTQQSMALQVVQPDGKVLVTDSSATAPRLLRLNGDGSVDSGFNADAVRNAIVAPAVLAIQPDGKLLVRQFIGSIEGTKFVRLNVDGSVDSSFASAIQSVDAAAADQTSIYVATNLTANTTSPQYAVVRLLPDGTRDPHFEADIERGAKVNQLTLQVDGQLLIGGSFKEVNGTPRNGIARIYGAAPRKIANISTRALVGADESSMIGGFIVTGTAPKKVLIRAIGPSLASNGVSSASVVHDPAIELHNKKGALIAANDNWRSSQEAEILATGIAPPDDAEAAIVATLAPGTYTAVIHGGSNDTGIGLVEIYDLDPAADSALANISTRGVAGTGNEAMIAGVIIRGADPSGIVLRGLGRSLAFDGVEAPLGNPSIVLYDQSGTPVASNDDWKQTQATELTQLGMAPTDDLEAAIIAMLPPGQYTALLQDADGGSGGVGLVEAYQVQ